MTAMRFAPPGWSDLTPSQKARAAALTVAAEAALKRREVIPFAIFILDGAEAFVEEDELGDDDE
jgi:hypothetical protein